MILYHRDSIRELGGPGSGNWGHAGIPGQRGGSQKGTGGLSKRPESYKEKKSVKSKGDTHNKEDKKMETKDITDDEKRIASELNNVIKHLDINERNTFFKLYIKGIRGAWKEDGKIADINEDAIKKLIQTKTKW